MSQIEVIRTYLQMSSPLDHKRAEESEALHVAHLSECTPAFYRWLYEKVGQNYHWVDRLSWTSEQIADHLADPNISVWVLYEGDAPAGYFQLQKYPDGSTEIAYFGLLPEFIGKGLGKKPLSFAVDRAWERGCNRVWLHTCTMDDPAAMPNYIKRGFSPYKQETYTTDISLDAARASSPPDSSR